MSSLPVFGKGMLDLINEVFWMLQFSIARQAKRVRRLRPSGGGSQTLWRRVSDPLEEGLSRACPRLVRPRLFSRLVKYQADK